MRLVYLSSSLLALTLTFASGAHASPQSDLDRAMSPHASAVKMALADAPGMGAPAAVKVMDLNRESSACRSLRMEMDRARSSGPMPNQGAPRLSREGNRTTGIPNAPVYDAAAGQEWRYISQCR